MRKSRKSVANHVEEVYPGGLTAQTIWRLGIENVNRIRSKVSLHTYYVKKKDIKGHISSLRSNASDISFHEKKVTKIFEYIYIYDSD